MRRLIFLSPLVLLFAACGSSNNSNPPPPSGGATITISGFAFSPDSMTVDAGTMITVKNGDGTPHTVTSESADSAFTPGAVNGVSFDTGSISAGGSATFTIPTSAPSGMTIPYYCSIHRSGMATPNGHITVR